MSRLPIAALMALALSVPEGPHPTRKPQKVGPTLREQRRQRKAKNRAARKARARNRRRS